LGEEGITFSIFSVAFTAVISTTYFLKKHNLKVIIPTINEFFTEFKVLFKLGLGFSIVAIMGSGLMFFSQVYLNSKFDLKTVGIYQASWTISNVYINTILVAIGVDFMPRIAKVISNKVTATKLINEQIEFGVLVSSIGIACVLIFSPLVLKLFYSADFINGVSIIRWQVIGVALRVLAFPFSYAIIARNKPLLFILTHFIAFSLDYILLVFFSKHLGFLGLGLNYCLSYIVYATVVILIARKLFNFKFSRLAIKIFIISWIIIITSWVTVMFFDYKYSLLIGTIIILFNLIWILKVLKNEMEISIITILKRKLLK